MNNLTDLGGGSVLPSLAATKKSLSPWIISGGFFLSTMGLLISGISLIANSLILHSGVFHLFHDGAINYSVSQ